MKKIESILKEILAAGGQPYLVGGSVRDFVLGRKTKDIDIEVHKLSVDDLQKCLEKFGKVFIVGKQFGVLRLSGFDIDWSLPRKDSKGRKPIVEVDSNMSIEDALRRRDVTMNAMAIPLDSDSECVREKIIDPFGGLEDIKKKQLRAVDEILFTEDPLRFYRVMQFISRFEMYPDEKLRNICKIMNVADAQHGGELARERVYEELCKLLLLSEKPSLGFRWVKDIGRLKELFPELGDTVGVYQREDYHPEGDVFEHTMQALDSMAKLVRDNESDEFRLVMLWGILCHDFGKTTTSDEFGSAKGHEVVGVPMSKTFLRRFTKNSHLIKTVGKLVRYHCAPIMAKQGAKAKAYKRLAGKLAPEVTVQQLTILARADVRGRNPKESEPLEYGILDAEKVADMFLEQAIDAKVDEHPEEPVLQGRDLIDFVKPGPEMGQLLREAYNIQIDEGIQDAEELKRRVLEN